MLTSIQKVVAMARAAWSDDRKRIKIKRKSDELEFLPAALEILETPASPAGRTLMVLIVSIFFLALVWGYFGQINTVAVARGKIIPGGRVKRIQALETGLVRAIHVQEGDHVIAGDILIELDPTENRVDKERIQLSIASLTMTCQRLEVTLKRLGGKTAELEPVSGMGQKIFLDNRKKVESDLADVQNRLAVLKKEGQALEVEGAVVLAEIEKITAILPIIQQKERAMESLYRSGSGTRFAWLEIKQELIQQNQDLIAQHHRLDELAAQRGSNREKRKQILSDFKKERVTEHLQALEEIEQSRLELKRAQKREDLNRLTAPVDGKVQNLKIHTLGGVAESAQELMIIVPDNTPLEIEALALNKDIGFIKKGQTVEIKVDSFPFTRYGLIKGNVARISADALENEQMGLVYPITVSMNDDKIQVKDRFFKLVLGMAVTAEIKTDDRRIIDYFLSPLLTYQSEALRER